MEQGKWSSEDISAVDTTGSKRISTYLKKKYISFLRPVSHSYPIKPCKQMYTIILKIAYRLAAQTAVGGGKSAGEM